MHLEVHPEKCTGCRICENFCSFHHEGIIWPERARIRVIAESDVGLFRPNHCRQCDDAPCADVCPVEAIALNAETGAWIVDDETCIGCGACIDACPYDAMFFDEIRDVSFKCNLCDGAPECAAMCPTGAVEQIAN